MNCLVQNEPKPILNQSLVVKALEARFSVPVLSLSQSCMFHLRSMKMNVKKDLISLKTVC